MNTPTRAVALVAGLLVVSVGAPGIAGGYAPAPGNTGGSGASADAPTGVTLVTECRTIDSPGYYRLATDLEDRTENRCIRILASDVVFDGAGHRIDGVGKYLFDDDGTRTSTKAILAKQGPLTNVTVENVEVTEYGYGLWFGDTHDSRIVNNTFRDNGIYGLYIGYGAHDNRIANNRVLNTSAPGEPAGQGIVVANVANRNEIVDNYVRNSEMFGIAVHLGNHTRIVNNTVLDSGEHGITGVGEGTVIRDNVVKRSAALGIDYKRADGARISANVLRDNRRGINFVRSDDAVITRNVVADNDDLGIRFGQSDDGVISRNVIADNGGPGIRVFDDAGAVVLRHNRFANNGEWDVQSRQNAPPTTVDNATFGDGTRASFVGRRVTVAGGSTPPAPLPEDTRAVSGHLKVWSNAGDRAWLDLTMPYDGSAVDEELSVDLWIYRGSWRRVPSSAVDRGPGELSTNVTGIDSTLYVVVAAGPEATPTTTSPTPSQTSPAATPTTSPTSTSTSSPTGSPTSSPSPTASPSPDGSSADTPGFGIAVAVVALLLAGVIAREYRG